jgi:hypothetical protein
MGQILTLDKIISYIEIKSTSNMEIYPFNDEYSYTDVYTHTYTYNKCQKYNPDKIYYNSEYMMDCILNVELVEEPIVAKYIEDNYGVMLDVV